MTVLVLAWVLGCDGSGSTAAPRDVAPFPADAARGAPVEVPATAPALRAVEIVLEPGRMTDDGWESVPAGADRLLAPDARAFQAAVEGAAEATGARRWHARLAPGPGVARVARVGCTPVEVPYVVDPVGLVVLPYPTCGAEDAPAVPGRAVRLDRDELPWSVVAAVHTLGLFAAIPEPAPGEDDGPARWLTLADARALCAWRGGRLPTAPEWRAARPGATGTPVSDATRPRLGSGPVGAAARQIAGVPPLVSASGHRDLDGDVDEWLDDGTVAGGSWISSADELGGTRSVPPDARTDTIGVRCAWDAPTD